MNVSCPSSNGTTEPLGGHQVWEVVVIVLITGPLSLVTIVGNLLVVVSVRVNRQLHTINNYFLLSLAVADLILGSVSMNLYTAYILLGRWPLSNLACDIWLAVDYVSSNASVMNLLLISFDRYFSITRPLTYRVKRTPRRAGFMIGLAWTFSFLLWAPAILFWEHVKGKRTVEEDKCSIQFLSEPAMTIATAIAAFYLPVVIMIILYWRIYRETRNRTRDLVGLLGLARDAPRWPPSHPGSIKSSCSSRGTPDRARPGRPGCFPIHNKRAGGGGELPALPSHLRGSSNSSWELEEDATSLSSSEDEIELNGKVVSTVAVRVPLINLGNAAAALATGKAGIAMATDPCTDRQGSLSSLSQGRGSTPKARPRHPKANKRRNIVIKEKKAAKMLSAILLAFIITWTPYNIMVVVSIFYCVPETLWQLGYWLCYVNSTVNPMCYALCNESFRLTFKMLLLCRWDKRKFGQHNHLAHVLTNHRSSSTV